MKITRLRAFYIAFGFDGLAFMAAAFAGNLLVSYLEVELALYVVIAFVATCIYLVSKWFILNPERLALLAHKSLADTLTDSAQAYGIVDIYNMQLRKDQDRRNSDTQETIDSAKVMRLAANSGASYLSVGLNRHWLNVRNRLAERTPFKVVLLDPFSAERQLRNTINAAGEPEDSKLPLGDIIRACNEFPELDIRLASEGMTCTIFITDNEAYFDPYHLGAEGGRISNLFICLRVAKMIPAQGLSNYEMLSRHFDALWAASKPLNRWLEENEASRVKLPGLSAPRG